MNLHKEVVQQLTYPNIHHPGVIRTVKWGAEQGYFVMVYAL